MAEQQVVLAGVRHCLGKELQVGRRTGRIVRVVQPHQGSLLGCLGRDDIQVRQEAPLRWQWERIDLRTSHGRAHRVGRVAYLRHQCQAIPIEARQCHVDDPLLGADEGHDLSLWVERHAEPALVVPGNCLAEGRNTPEPGVAMVIRAPR